ncbi:MAG TPA: type II and III secretion system protein [Chitinophagaceae bacterium]|jgi:type IV pilus assembly protein PilQ
MNNFLKALIVEITFIILLFSLTIIPYHLYAQQDRFQVLEQRLKDLSGQVPGLNQKTELSVSNISLAEFLRALASANSLNLNVDPTLTQKISNNFSDEKPINILVFLARQFNLDLNFVGTIISIYPYQDPNANIPPPPKELKISYNSFTQNISMDLQDDTLQNVAKKITQLSNKNIIVEPELYNKKITEYIQELPVLNALEKIAITHAFKINITNDDVIILEPLKSNEELVSTAKLNPNANYAVRQLNKNQPGSSSIEINDENGKKNITLNVVNAPIKDVIKDISQQAGINYFVYSELTGTTTASVTNMEFEKVLGYILQGTRFTYNVEKGVYMIGERRDEGLRAKKLIQLQFRSVDSLVAIIPAQLKDGVEIKEFKELNSFLLSGSQPQIKEIESFVKQVDKLVPMVTIEVILLDVTKSHTVSTGISAGTADSVVRTGGSILGPTGLNYTFGALDINQFLNRIGLNNVFNMGRVSPNFYVNITALESNANVNLRQTPKLSTLNGHTANLSIGSTQYYSISTQNVLGSLTPQTVVTQQYIPVEANTIIDITPFVSGDDDVTLTIGVSITNFTANPPANQPPPTSTSKFKSIIRVKNEDMVVLGGIERTEKSESGSGIPILSRIPVLKWIFSSRSKTNSKVVSVVFIKPTIIYH